MLGGVAAAMFLAAAARAQIAPPPTIIDTHAPVDTLLAETPLSITARNMTGSRGPEGDVVNLNGDVRITRGSTVITAERGRYVRAIGMLYLNDHVKLVDSTTTVTCDEARYSEKNDRLNVKGRVVVVDGESRLEGPEATYDRAKGIAEMWGGVSAKDKDQRLLADRAIYVRDSTLLKARGNVRASDTEGRNELHAREVDYDRDDHFAIARGAPVLRSHEEGGGGITELRARLLKLDTEARIAEAIDSVTVDRDTLHARADYARFDDSLGTGFLTGSPRAWDEETNVTGDTIWIHSVEKELDRVVVLGNATMDYKGIGTEQAGEQNRLTGQRVELFFIEDELDSLVATGTPQNLYSAPPRAGKTAETNATQGDTIVVFFDDRAISKARVQGNATGEYQFAVNAGDTAAAASERINYDARSIEFLVPSREIVLDPGAHLTYNDLELRAQRVVFNSEKQTLVARGDPQLQDRGDDVEGNLMTYDLTTRVGNIYQAETKYETGFYHGDRIRKATENQLEVLDGSYTTCTLPHPHYRFQSHWMKIYLKDKVVAKPVVFYVENVPVLPLPFWFFPLRTGRQSGFLFPQFELGFNQPGGQFVRNLGYYYAPNDYVDFTVSGDFYQADPSWVIRGESQYRLQYVLDGEVNGSFQRNQAFETEEWDFNAFHNQELTPRTRFIGRASFVSSREYNSSNQYGRPLALRLNRFLTSSLSLTHNADWATVAALLERREDLDADQALEDPDGPGPAPGPPVGSVASLPSLSVVFPTLSMILPTRAVGSVGLFRNTPLEKALASMYVSVNGRFQSFKERRGFVLDRQFSTTQPGSDSILVIGQSEVIRHGFQTDISVSDARRAFGWLTVRPNLNSTVAVFDHDELGNKNVPTGTWSTGVGTSATFYGTYKPSLGPLTGLRHVLFPFASVVYSPEFPHLVYTDSLGFQRNRFQSFGSIGVSGFKSFRTDFGLDQRLQVKLRHGENTVRLDNLMSLAIRSSYNFLWKEQNQKHPFTPITWAFLLQPPAYLSSTVSWVTDVYDDRPLRSLGATMGFRASSSQSRRTDAPDLAVDRSAAPKEIFDDAWEVNLAYSYAGGRATNEAWTNSQNINAVTTYQLSPAWHLEYSTSYDITLRHLGTQQFSLLRDLHCWQIQFTRTFVGNGESEFYFRLGIKDQPEVYVDRGTRGGTIGGID